MSGLKILAPMKPTALSLILILAASCLAAACSDTTAPQSGTDSLIIAAEQGDLQKLDRLLLDGSPSDVRDSCQWTPLMKAALNGHTAVAQRLLDSGAMPELSDKGGYTALMLAASNNHHQLVQLLVDRGADINRQELTGGWSALLWAAKRGHEKTVHTLLQAGADPGLKDNKGKRAIDWARENGYQRVVSLLGNS